MLETFTPKKSCTLLCQKSSNKKLDNKQIRKTINKDNKLTFLTILQKILLTCSHSQLLSFSAMMLLTDNVTARLMNWFRRLFFSQKRILQKFNIRKSFGCYKFSPEVKKDNKLSLLTILLRHPWIQLVFTANFKNRTPRCWHTTSQNGWCIHWFRRYFFLKNCVVQIFR